MSQSTQEERNRHAGAHILPTTEKGNLSVDIGGVRADQRHMHGLSIAETNAMPPSLASQPSDEIATIALNFAVETLDAFPLHPDSITIETDQFEYESERMVQYDIEMEVAHSEPPMTDVHLECFDFEVRDEHGKTIMENGR